MVQVLYNIPLPNNGERYDLSKEELNDLLYKAYRNGFEHARDVYDPERQAILTAASTYGYEGWKETYLK